MRWVQRILLPWAAWCLLGSCTQDSGFERTHKPLPPEDGERVIRYLIDVTEDDSRCGADVPYKYSQEQMVVEWHSNRHITIFLREGLYQAEGDLDDNGRYEHRGTAGPCGIGSYIKGRLDRQSGEGEMMCRRVDCDIYVYLSGHRMEEQPDGGTADGGEPPSQQSQPLMLGVQQESRTLWTWLDGLLPRHAQVPRSDK